MFYRSALILFSLLASSFYLAACSCGNTHFPLEDVICHADTSGGMVLELEMTIRIDNNQQARFRVVDVHVGNTNIEELNLSGVTSCAWYMNDDDQPGSRFLYISNPDWIRDGQGELFGCGLNSNIYRMNRRGTQIEYPVGVNGQNTRLAYRNFYAAVSACIPGGIRVNPLRDLVLTNNPGSGLMNLLSAAPELPEITSIDVYTSAGQIVRHVEPEYFGVAGERIFPGLNLWDMPGGIYFVVVRQGDYLKTLRYVKR